jgi:hypothetical protein
VTVSEQLKSVVDLLLASGARYALAGGLVASLYRKNIRMTRDVDFLFFTGAGSETEARKTLKACGLQVSELRKADLEGGPLHAIKSKSTPILLLAGRTPGSATGSANGVGVDFLLPGFPWFDKALERAEKNHVDFGFGKLPCLTAEDVLLSKFYSAFNRADRFQDFDDIKEICLYQHELDLNYLTDQIRELELRIPAVLKDSVPGILWKTSKSLTNRGSR